MARRGVALLRVLVPAPRVKLGPLLATSSLRTSPAGAAKGRAGGAAPGAPVCASGQNNLQKTTTMRHRFDLGTCFDSAHCSRHRSPRAEHETPALMPPASARKASASRHRPASGFCKHWCASTAPWRARAATAGTSRRVNLLLCGAGAPWRSDPRRRRLLDSLLRSAQSVDY